MLSSINPVVIQSPVEWANNMLADRNPIEVLEAYAHPITCHPAGAIIIEKCIQDAMRVADAYHSIGTRHGFEAVEAWVIKNSLKFIKEIDGKRGHQPADAYASGSSPCACLQNLGSTKAKPIIRELLEMQSMPYGELDNPDFIDQMTGEIQEREYITVRSSTLEGAELDAQLNSESYNDDLDDQEMWDDPLVEAAEPTWKLIADEEKSSPQAMFELKGKAAALKKFYLSIYEPVRSSDGSIDHEATAESLRDQIRASREFKALFRTIVQLASEYPAKDILQAFISVNNDYMLDDEDAFSIPVSGAGCANLGEYMLTEEGETILDGIIVTDFMGNKGEVSAEDIAKFSDEYLQEFLAACPVDDKDIKKTRAYNEGYMAVMLNSKNITRRLPDGTWENLAIATGYEYYRAHKSPEGNVAFHAAIRAGKDVKEAMREFYKVSNKEKVIGIRPDGVTLTSGRKISWFILQLKLKHKEVDLSKEDFDRLLKTAEEKGWKVDLQWA